MDVRVKIRAEMRGHDWDTKIKWWHLKDQNQSVFLQKKIEGRLCEATYKRKWYVEQDDIWD